MSDLNFTCLVIEPHPFVILKESRGVFVPDGVKFEFAHNGSQFCACATCKLSTTDDIRHSAHHALKPLTQKMERSFLNPYQFEVELSSDNLSPFPTPLSASQPPEQPEVGVVEDFERTPSGRIRRTSAQVAVFHLQEIAEDELARDWTKRSMKDDLVPETKRVRATELADFSGWGGGGQQRLEHLVPRDLIREFGKEG